MRAPSDDLWDVLATARTIRRFTDEPVDDLTLSRCLQAAAWAPSGANAQGWRFIVLRSPEQRAVVAEAAARALATVIETREPAGPARDAKVAALRQAARSTETLGTMRDGLLMMARQVAGNEVAVLTGLHDRVDTGVESYRHRLAMEPLLKLDLEPALDFLDGAAEQANATRKRNEAWRAATEARLKAQLTAAARAEGRSEATEALSDRVAAALGKNDK